VILLRRVAREHQPTLAGAIAVVEQFVEPVTHALEGQHLASGVHRHCLSITL
jgi:hypothetical protein